MSIIRIATAKLEINVYVAIHNKKYILICFHLQLYFYTNETTLNAYIKDACSNEINIVHYLLFTYSVIIIRVNHILLTQACRKYSLNIALFLLIYWITAVEIVMIYIKWRIYTAPQVREYTNVLRSFLAQRNRLRSTTNF